MKTTWLFRFHLCLSVFPSVQAQNTTSDFLENLIPPDYPSNQPPIIIRTDGKNKHVEPAIVYFRVRPEFVTSISMKDMEFSVDLTLRVEWHDYRLNLDQASKYIKGVVDLPREIEEKLWRPDIRFENLKGDDNRVVLPTRIQISSIMSQVAFAVNGVGLRVYYRKTYRFMCDLNFSAYPFDVQVCEIQIMLYTKTQPFEPVATNLATGVTIEQIKVPPGFRMRKFDFVHRHNSTRLISGETFTIIHESLIFRIRRVFAQHIMLIFLPSVLVVMLSWLSFWLDPATPAPRVALGLTTLLTLSTQFTVAQKDLPPVADVKALDIWMFCCIFMVFASLLEFGMAHLMKAAKTSSTQKVFKVPQHVYIFSKPVEQDCVHPVRSEGAGKNVKNCCHCCKILKPQESTVKIDAIARIAFPICFLIFNIAFWCHYCIY